MISNLKLRNWTTHLDTELEFSKGVNALLGFMGTGKSSILNAVCFALFGTFPSVQQRKIKLDNVLMRYPEKKDNAEIELEFSVEGKNYKIQRKIERKKGTTYSKIECDGTILEAPNTQRVTELVEKTLKINYDLFSQIIYSEQNKLDYFLTIPKGQRTKKVDELLKLDRFEEARSNTVKLMNKLKERTKTRREDFQKLDKQVKEIDVKSIEKDIKNKQNELSIILKNIKELEDKKEKLSKIVGELKEKRMLHKELDNECLSFKSKIEHIGAEIKKSGKLEEGYTHGFVEKQINILNKALENQNLIEKRIIELRQQEVLLTEQIKELKNKISELESKKDKLKDLENLEKLIKDSEKKLKENISLIAGFESKLSEEQRAIDELSKASANCPTCEAKLDKLKKEKLVAKKNKNIDGLKNKISLENKNQEKINKAFDELKNKHQELLRYSNVINELKEFSDKSKELSIKLDKANSETKELESKFSDDKKEKISGEIKRFEKIRDILSLIDNKKQFELKLKESQDKLKKLDFDEKILEKNEKTLNDADKKLGVSLEKENSINLLLKEKNEKLDNIQNQLNLVEDYKKEVEKLEWVDDELNKFKVVLEKTQVSLREKFIESINYTMSDIWTTLYPYEDYVDICLNIDGDYILQLKNADGTWVNVEGDVSGGERTSAVLALRLALGMVLAPNLKWLVLDEPTANLDINAIEELARTFREKISDLVEQVFLITHDENLSEAVTGKLYKLERGEGKKEITKVVAV